MRTDSRLRRATVVAATVLLLILTVAVASGGSDAGATTSFGRPELPGSVDDGGRVIDVATAIVVPVAASWRAVELRIALLWVLPELVAAMAALCLLRRRRAGPGVPRRLLFLRGAVSHRAPPFAPVG